MAKKMTVNDRMTMKDALSKWEEESGEKRSEAKHVKLYGQIPPIEKMDASLSALTNCEQLSLSTNCIEKITNLNGLKNLKILSLGRNNIKSLAGVEVVSDTLEELWISYNQIEKLKGIQCLKNLKVLYMSNNLVKEWVMGLTFSQMEMVRRAGCALEGVCYYTLYPREFVRLAELPRLVDLVFVGNPLEEKHSAEGTWMDEATKRLPNLEKLDGTLVIKQKVDEGEGES